MAELNVEPVAGVHRPRNVDWKRAAALLYGDWGTSKAYVIGLAFAAAAYSSFPLIIAVCVLTAIVGFNYLIVCAHFPDGGGVYSAAREQSRLLAVVGALLLVANFCVTAALSGWAAVSYLGVPNKWAPVATMGLVLVVGVINWFGPKHSGSVSVSLAIPTVVVVLVIIGLSAPHLTTEHLLAPHADFSKTWVQFVGVILALSGVEAVANLTGVMKLDRGATMDKPTVKRTSRLAILPVAAEVVIGTTLLGWAMLSIPRVHSAELLAHKEDMLRYLGSYFGGLTIAPAFGDVFGWIVGIVFGLLLFSAVNTAIVALIGVFYMMARDGEMPPQLTRLNSHGVPLLPLVVAVVIPILILSVTKDFEALAGLYAIGVVGAIAVNLGACTFNAKLGLILYERLIMGGTFFILALVELTIAKTKPEALFFAVIVLGIGLAMRAYSHKLSGIKTVTLARHVVDIVSPESMATFEPRIEEGQKIMVAARGITPVLGFALDEAVLRKSVLCVLYVKEIAVIIPTGPVTIGRPKWQDDPEANAIMSLMLKLGEERGVCVLPVYAVSDNASATILDLTATMGVDYLMIGTSHRRTLANLLRGNVVTTVAQQLPDSIRLLIFG